MVYFRGLKPSACFLLAIAAYLAPLHAAPPPASDATQLLQDTKLPGGLAVFIGSDDGALEGEFAATGKWVVKGLASTPQKRDASRKALMEKGFYGVASVDWHASLNKLPFAKDLITLLMVDKDAGLTLPSQAELLRCVSPQGVLAERSGGSWKTTVKSRPSGYGDWTHWWASPTGTGVSNDDLGSIPNSIRWVANNWKIKAMSNESRTGIRVEKNRLSYSYTTGVKGAAERLVGRDSYNGILLWERNDYAAEKSSFNIGDGKIQAFMKKNGLMEQINATTGETMRTYDQGLAYQLTNWGHNGVDGGLPRSLIAGSLVIQSKLDTMVALDATTGARKWRVLEKEGKIWFPVADESKDILCAIIATGTCKWDSHRWSTIQGVKALVCYKLSTGDELWRQSISPGSGQLSQLAISGDKLVVFKSAGTLGGDDATRCLEARKISNGDLIWNKDVGSTHMVVWNNAVCVWKSNFLSLNDGSALANPALVVNGRCNRFTASQNILIGGLVTYFNKNFGHQRSTITRSQCATGSIVANNMVYFTPAGCGCIENAVMGYQALEVEDAIDSIADKDRLQSAQSYSLGNIPTTQKFASTGPIALDWSRTNYAYDSASTTPPVSANGRTYVAYVHQHRLEAKKGETLDWSFVTGGRISTPPVIAGGRVHVASVDGWVYTLEESTGKLLWRFLAAPGHRQVVAYSQLESAWPVYGVVLADGKLCFSAGRHAELGGGIYVYAVDPATGAQKWRIRIDDKHKAYTAVQRASYDVNKYIAIRNDALIFNGTNLVLPGRSINPADPNAAVKLSQPFAKSIAHINALSIQQVYGKGLKVSLKESGLFSARLLDIQGRTITSFEIKGPSERLVKLPTSLSGFLVLELGSSNGRIIRAMISEFAIISI